MITVRKGDSEEDIEEIEPELGVSVAQSGNVMASRTVAYKDLRENIFEQTFQ